VWSKALSTPGERAVVLLNRTGDQASIKVNWSDLGLVDSAPATVKDVWSHMDMGSFNSSYSATVASLDAVMIIVHGSDAELTTYTPSAAKEEQAGDATVEKDEPVTFTHVTSRFPMARVRVVYTNPDKATRFAALRVNGHTATRIAFPSTGSTTGSIWIESPLDRKGPNNELNFARVCGPGPSIASIAVE
jgi:hypothetical protein